MAIDASIALGVKPLQMPDPVNQLAKVLQIQGMQDESGMNRLKMQEYQRGIGEQDAVAKLMTDPSMYQNGRLDTTALTPKIYAAAPTKAAGVLKGLSDQRMADATYDKTQLEAVKQRTEIAGQVFGSVRANPTLETASQALDYLGTHGIFKPDEIAKYKAQLTPENVGSFADTMFRASLHAKDQLGKIETKNIGGQTVTQMTDPLTGKTQNVNTMQNTQSPDSVASNLTSRANNRDTIAAENVRAGVTPGGGLDDNAERTAQAIANGQLPAPTGMALLNPKNQRILGRVMEINPQYDASTVSAKKTAAAAFTSGPLGNALRSVSTANAHLDQLGELADALENGNTQVINKVGNYFSKQTGNPAVTNFDAIKAIVGQEVVKAIVAGGGGVGEREEAAKIFSTASSPAQLKGAIQHYRMVMGAQANNLMEQRRAAGLPDSTLPNYGATNTTPGAAPAGWTYMGTTK